MKKGMYLLLALVLCVVVLTACGEGETTGNNQTPSSTIDSEGQHTHTYGDWIVVLEASCSAEGQKVRTCACGETEREWISRVAHTPETWEGYAPTCLSSGYTDGERCSVCGAELKQREYLEPLEHSYGEWTVTTEPTCTWTGEQQRKCVNCGQSEWERIKSTGHAYGEWEVTIQPTCTETGERQRKCDRCGQTERKSVSATGHEEVTDIAVAATCTSTGLASGGHCANCDYVLKKQETLPKLSHTVENDVCQVCGAKASQGLVYTLNTDKQSYAVSGFGTCLETEIIIPSTYEGKPVTQISQYAFSNLSILTDVTIPDSVLWIDDDAFNGCTKLETVTLGKGVIYIGDDAFESYSSLKTLHISDIAAWCAIEYGNSSVVPSSIVDSIYLNNELLTELIIPEGTTLIQRYAFYGYDKLTSIALPDSVDKIGYAAFYNTDFYNDPANWTEGALYIGNHLIAVNSEQVLGTYTVREGTVTIGDYAFTGCKMLLEVVIPDSVKNIGDSAFAECTSLTDLTIGNGVSNIYNRAFYYCSNLHSIVIPDSVTSIGNFAFLHCKGLTSVTIGSGVTSIGRHAFSNCSSLTSIVIPNSVKTIGYAALNRCYTLKNITIPFVGTQKSDDTMDTSFSSLFGGISNTSNLSEMSVIITGGTNIADQAFYDCSYITNITLPDSVTSIDDYAFYNCSSLTSLVIPDGVTCIGRSSFSSCNNLSELTIGSGVKTIGDFAFAGCYGLTNVTYLGTADQWTAIEKGKGWSLDYYILTKDTDGEETVPFQDAVTLLKAVWAMVPENQRFFAGGGDYDNIVYDDAGVVLDTIYMTGTLRLPEALVESVDNAASLIHGTNLNSMTVGAYQVKDGTDLEAFAAACKEGLAGVHWMCGFPEISIVAFVDDIVVFGYGLTDNMLLIAQNLQRVYPNCSIFYGEIVA